MSAADRNPPVWVVLTCCLAPPALGAVVILLTVSLTGAPSQPSIQPPSAERAKPGTVPPVAVAAPQPATTPTSAVQSAPEVAPAKPQDKPKGATPAPAVEPVPLEREKVRVIVEGTSVSINGTNLPLPPSRAAIIKLLGKPTRISQLAYGIIITWDEHGFYATEDVKTEKLVALTVALDKRAFMYWPKKAFGGAVGVDGASVTAQSTIEEINRVKKGKLFERNKVVTDSWTIQYDDVMSRLSLVEADPEHKSENARFSYLQIGFNLPSVPTSLEGAWVLEQLLVDGKEPEHPGDYYQALEFKGDKYRFPNFGRALERELHTREGEPRLTGLNGTLVAALHTKRRLAGQLLEHTFGPALERELPKPRLTGTDGQLLTADQLKQRLAGQLGEVNNAGAAVSFVRRRGRFMLEAGGNPGWVQSWAGRSTGDTAGSFTVDVKVSPARMTMKAETGLANTDTVIYEFRARRLVICFPERHGDPTPKDFQPHHETVVMVFKPATVDVAAVKGALAALDGVWQVERFISAGRDITDNPEAWSVEFNQYLLAFRTRGTQYYYGNYLVYVGASPAQMDVLLRPNDKPPVHHKAIYEIRGDSLRWAMPHVEHGRRPTDFEPRPENEVMVMRRKR